MGEGKKFRCQLYLLVYWVSPFPGWRAELEFGQKPWNSHTCSYVKIPIAVGPFIYVLFLLSQKKQTTALFLLWLHLIMSLLLQLSSLSSSFWLPSWQRDTSPGMVSAAFFPRCFLVLMKFLCRIHIYRNFTVTLGISVSSSLFSHFLFFFFFPSASTVTKSLAHDFPAFCVQATLEFRFESEEVTGEFWQQIKIFPKSGIMKRFTKVQFHLLRCLSMPCEQLYRAVLENDSRACKYMRINNSRVLSGHWGSHIWEQESHTEDSAPPGCGIPHWKRSFSGQQGLSPLTDTCRFAMLVSSDTLLQF